MPDLTKLFSEHQIEIIKDNLGPRPEGKTVRHDLFSEPVPIEVDWLKLATFMTEPTLPTDPDWKTVS